MDNAAKRKRLSLETQVEVLSADMKGLRRDVDDIRSTLERWVENASRERMMIILAVVSAWLGLIAAAITALFRK